MKELRAFLRLAAGLYEQPDGRLSFTPDGTGDYAEGREDCASEALELLEAERKCRALVSLEQLRDICDLSFCVGCGIDVQSRADHLIEDFLACPHDQDCWLADKIKEAKGE